MPIKPENRDRYPKDWPKIRGRILARAGQKRDANGKITHEAQCENCGAPNHTWIMRDGDKWDYARTAMADLLAEYGAVRVILTIAHLDHQPETRDENLLRAWCQRCHNRYDIGHRKQTRRATREKGQLQFEE